MLSLCYRKHKLAWKKALVFVRVSSQNFLHKNCAKIMQRLGYVLSKNFTKFGCFCALMCKSYFAQILKKILLSAYLVISCYFVILSYFVISLNFEKQFQEMISEFKIKPIRVNFTPACLVITHDGQMSPIFRF